MAQSHARLAAQHVMARDAHRLRRWAERLAVANDSAEQARWQAAVAASEAVVQARQAAVPAMVLPESLPVTARSDEIVAAIKSHQVVIVAGETGSGKTTQLPKLCLQAGLGRRGFIGHTQPRRLAARSVARRIAEELGVELGATVGYRVRFHDEFTADSLVKIMTDGILLAEMAQDRHLNQYDALIIDEAHERSLNIDFLLGYLKQLLRRRRDLKVIITSATIDHERFSRFFDGAPVIEVSGRSYPVEVQYQPLETAAPTDPEAGDEAVSLEQGVLAAVESILTQARQPQASQRPDDILVFLSGEREIRQVGDYLRRHGPPQLEVLPLYARLTNDEQNRIFKPHAQRRIVLATNVAETSLTVPRIGYVIDSGLARISRYSVRSKVQRLPIEAVSRASADQRAGRCGRIAPGLCIRLYSESDYLARPQYTEPEILRTNLASVILQMHALKLGNPHDFPFLEPPDKRLISDGYRLLEELSASDQRRKITPLGQALTRFPVDPRIARALLAAKERDCLREMLIIASGLSVPEPWTRPHGQQSAADAALAQFQHAESDFLTFVNVWEAIEVAKAAHTRADYRRWLVRHFLGYLRVSEWQQVYRQLKQLCHELNWQENSEPARYEDVHQALLTGFLSHIAQREERSLYQAARNRQVMLFPGSGVSSKRAPWLVAAEIMETQRVYARTVARVDPTWIPALAGHLLKRSYDEPHWQKKRAAAMAYEQASLFGLVLYSRKLTSYTQVDSVLSRELFIRHALVQGEYDTRAAWARHNRQLIQELEYLERKSRKRDILIDELDIYALFDAIVPAQVVNGKSFERWRKQAEQQQPKLLFLTREQLVRGDNDQVSAQSYPDQMPVAGGKIRIKYQFDPGKQRDGLNIVIPITVLNQVEPAQLEWLVPGLEFEKCVALIKSLPKPIRKHFVPAPDYANAFLATEPDRQQSLLEQLATFLRQRKNVAISARDFDETTLDDYLRAHLRVHAVDGATLAEGRDIVAIKRDLADSFKASLDQLQTTDSAQQPPVASWEFGTIEPEYISQQQGTTVKAYPALVDCGDGVQLQLFETRYRAQQEMRIGLRRLFLLNAPAEVRYVRKQLKLPQEAMVQFAPFGDQKALVAGLVARVFDLAFIDDQPSVYSETEFEQRLQSGKQALGGAIQAVHQLLLDIFTELRRVRSLLATDHSPARAYARQDIKAQLDILFPEAWLTTVPQAQLIHYPRYLRAITRRWERLQGKIERDQELGQEIAALWQRYQQRIDSGALTEKEKEALDSWRWALEEYRISVFAQGIKTAFPISAKRLERLWQDSLH